MDDTQLEGTITFVQHEKKFVSIEYLHNGKLKNINGSIKDAAQQKLIDEKLIKKFHHFREGDEVTFVLTRSIRGDKMVADRIRFRFNNSLSNLLHKAKTGNQFSGYIKQVDDQYFIKEIDSYHFFPLRLSPWEHRPTVQEMEQLALFSLENYTNPDKVTALLVHRQFIPEYKKAMTLLDKKQVIEAPVLKVTPHAIYVGFLGNKIQGKLSLPKDKDAPVEKEGDKISIIIKYISPERIVVERVKPI
ncbi:MAG TPA: hypothetical protein VK644_11475 [Chitinophagaceae bacterium]|nr:hypothetical protein [Chitinophagaceae bacterium]